MKATGRRLDDIDMIQHLTTLPRGEAEISLGIRVQALTGVPDEMIRTVKENAKALGSRSQSFEKE